MVQLGRSVADTRCQDLIGGSVTAHLKQPFAGACELYSHLDSLAVSRNKSRLFYYSDGTDLKVLPKEMSVYRLVQLSQYHGQLRCSLAAWIRYTCAPCSYYHPHK